ncbi:RNA polymerase sigma factor [Iodidimonas muriae]|uniref:RNA polymerase sigma factor n=2 Tax=Iodidimonas muriae TaxID=261467 RepID=A0ABQ2LGD4_9PROT|nr:RNA polymerase sigma factor [Iodidimonas muriae]
MHMKLSTHQAIARHVETASETDLIAYAIKGDGAAFETIMRRHNQLLFRTARSIVCEDSEAEDVVQESYLRAWRALGKFRAQSKLSTWLVRITTNEALGRLRRKRAQVIPLDAAMMSSAPEALAALTDGPQRAPEQSAQRSQMRKLIEQRIDQLPEAFRTVFVLRAIEEMSVEDVAQAMDIPEATVRTRFFRARSLLRESLAQDMDITIGEVFSFDGARCDRIVASVIERGKAEGLMAGN